MPKFVYDKKNLRFNIKKEGVGSILFRCLKYLFVSFLVALGCYGIFALVFSTDREKKLAAENRQIRAEYEQLSEKMKMVDDVIESLEIRDREIYNDIFQSDPPDYSTTEPEDSLTLRFDDIHTSSEKKLIEDVSKAIRKAEYSTNKVNYYLSVAASALAADGAAPTSIPSIVPIRNFRTIQTGASLGKKVNPFYKTLREHTGIDLLAPVGTEVLCSADGVVTGSSSSGRGFGNRVEITHKGGYVTTYSHLGDIQVNKGQNVKQGAVLGHVGMTGTTFAPCLHYEVVRNGKFEDPANYFFSDVTPVSYKEIMTIAQTTGQSMD